MTTDTDAPSSILPRRTVIYCGRCGMPPEYCEYGPDFESHCDRWLAQHHPELHEHLAARRGSAPRAASSVAPKKVRPAAPWTVEERLTEFYKRYAEDKLDTISSILEKYAGKEDKLFAALVQKYGEEPEDPYYATDSDEEEDEDDDEEEKHDDKPIDKKKRRGAAAKKAEGATTRVLIQKVAQKKKRNLTIVTGLETVPGLKLKDASKVFSKKFAGSSSVKKNKQGQEEVILQGDHMYEVAELIVDKFGVAESQVFLDMDGDVVPLK